MARINKNITLPAFVSDDDYLIARKGEAQWAVQGVNLYIALHALVMGYVGFDADKGTFKGVSPTAEKFGIVKSEVSKGAQVIMAFVPDYLTASADEVRNGVLAILAEYGSLSAAYAAIKPPQDKDQDKDPQGAKTVQELLLVAARRGNDQGLSLDDFLVLATEAWGVVTSK
jgi:hypothetical protein